ncbi:MAG: hypothetical protein ACXVY8_01020, partial [Gaiellaceae bacterium]
MAGPFRRVLTSVWRCIEQEVCAGRRPPAGASGGLGLLGVRRLLLERVHDARVGKRRRVAERA